MESAVAATVPLPATTVVAHAASMGGRIAAAVRRPVRVKPVIYRSSVNR